LVQAAAAAELLRPQALLVQVMVEVVAEVAQLHLYLLPVLLANKELLSLHIFQV
jgi:hypothetical protein